MGVVLRDHRQPYPLAKNGKTYGNQGRSHTTSDNTSIKPKCQYGWEISCLTRLTRRQLREESVRKYL